MNYIHVLKQFWKVYAQRELLPIDGMLYLFLVEVCNYKLWPKKFTLPNIYIVHRLRISEKTLIASRKRLVEVGMIEFVSGKATKECSIYKIVDPQAVKPRLVFPLDQSNCKKDNPQNTVTTTEKCSDSLLKNNRTNKNSFQTKETKRNAKEKPPEADASGNRGAADLFLKIKNDFNQACITQKKVKYMSEYRKELIRACIDSFGVDEISTLIKKVANSNFLNGRTKRGWVPQFNWIFKVKNAECILEGAFDNDTSTTDGQDNSASAAEMDEILNLLKKENFSDESK